MAALSRVSKMRRSRTSTHSKNHVNVGFFYGALLKDSAGILEGSGKRMRHVKLKLDSDLAAEDLRDLIDAAYADIKIRLGAEGTSNDG